jgi:uncharacterized membrane protein HdeD (DUF308 family)
MLAPSTRWEEDDEEVEVTTLEETVVGSARTILIIGGILGAITGAVVLFWPGVTLLVLAVLLGLNFLLGGVITTVASVTQPLSTGERVLGIIAGLLTLLAGVLVMTRPARSLEVLATIAGALWVVSGIAALIGAMTGDAESRGLAVLSGLISVAAGVVLITWPGVTLVAMAWIAGIWMLMFGIVRLIMGIRLPKLVGS